MVVGSAVTGVAVVGASEGGSVSKGCCAVTWTVGVVVGAFVSVVRAVGAHVVGPSVGAEVCRMTDGEVVG